jgi:hypothetical protein
MQVEKEIKQNLFSTQTWESELRELEATSDRLEKTIDRMMRLEDLFIDRGSVSIPQGGEEDVPIWNGVDSRFGHSWTPNGPPNGSGPGWFWIPRGRVCLDITYLARSGEVIRFGHAARKVRATPQPRELAKSFVEAVRAREMALPNRIMGKRRQEE